MNLTGASECGVRDAECEVKTAAGELSAEVINERSENMTTENQNYWSVKIGFNFEMVIAERCVRILESRQYELHRILLGEQDAFDPAGPLDDWEEMREFIRSLKSNSYQRMSFLSTLRYLIKKSREERNMPPRASDYVRLVIAAGNGHLVQPKSRFYAEAQAALALKMAA